MVWLLLGLALTTSLGCFGSDKKTDEQDQAEKQKVAEEKKKKDPLEIGPLLPIWGQELGEDALADPQPKILVKPGHWIPTRQSMRANVDDFVGTTTAQLIDSRQQPTALEHTRFRLQTTRPVVLAKGRVKGVEAELFVPEDGTGTHVRSRLLNRNTGSLVHQADPQLVKMPSYQYLLVVLAKEISRYGFLKVTDTVRAPWEEEYEEPSQSHYRVVLADASKEIPLSADMLTWSSMAYLVWDEVDLAQFAEDQQEALLDWLHWGGRLIINGPDSYDALRGSFLDEFLPAESTGTRLFTADDLHDWSEFWSERLRGERLSPVVVNRPWSGIRLEPRAGARELPGGGGLFYERDVGQGSIVISAVQLSQRDLINWPGFDGLLNAVLLRRPRRQFQEGVYGGLRVDWADYLDRRLDAHFTTGLRLFARDAATKANFLRTESSSQNRFDVQESAFVVTNDRPGGLASWGEFSPVSATSRESLTAAAGVQMPGAGFILACLAIYLVVLVPLNWMVFHSLGRVEWAWFAAPVIAIFGTIGVVRLAQLDIGFVRSQTEIALLELQGAHPRGLLSRFTALYSSLSTTYDIAFDDANTLATPFPISEEIQLRSADQKHDIVFEKHSDTALRGLVVSSNSTRMVHSEQMFALPGPLRLGLSSRNHPQVENRSGFDLQDVVVVRRYFSRSKEPSYEASWIGTLRDGSSTVLGLTPFSLEEDKIPFAEQRDLAEQSVRRERLNIDKLLQLAFRFPEADDPLNQRREEIRLVGRIDDVVPCLEIVPAASQIRGTTIVLAHLNYGEPFSPRPDLNSRDDVLSSTTE